MKEDLQDAAANGLIEAHGEPNPGLLYLVLFGRASPYLHNGSMEIKDESGEVDIQLLRVYLTLFVFCQLVFRHVITNRLQDEL